MNVEINGFTSSCKNDQCGYTYDDTLTPSIARITPTSGFGGETVTIACAGCEAGNDANIVMLGDIPCVVTSATTTSIQCTAGKSHIHYNIYDHCDFI